MFNKELVKSGLIAIEYGKLYNYLFGLRQEVNYEDFYSTEEEDIAPLVPRVERLLDNLREVITSNS